MLAHRLRRWPNISTTLAQLLVFAGTLSQCSTNGGPASYDAGPTLVLHCLSVTCLLGVITVYIMWTSPFLSSSRRRTHPETTSPPERRSHTDPRLRHSKTLLELKRKNQEKNNDKAHDRLKRTANDKAVPSSATTRNTNQSWFNAGPTSKTVAHYCTDV